MSLDPNAAATPNPRARRYMTLALAIIPVNTVMCILGIVLGASRNQSDAWFLFFLAFTALAIAQLAFGIAAVVLGVRERRASGGASGLGPIVAGTLAAIGAPLGWATGAFGMFLTLLGGAVGGAWGRPLRVRGRQLHPELRDGSDWTEGARPDGCGLDPHTRRALEALWLHDAQKEHASVPAFSRISWLLAAVGAPADLVEWSHRAALEEIAHTRLCFALAAGYGGRSHSVEPMPELVIGELSAARDPLVTLAVESLSDGCQLEDFNADVAAACALACEEPVTRDVLERIAREERSHAEFSWALLAWLLERDHARVQPAVRRALAELGAYPRPTAVSGDKLALVARADAAMLERHGRLPDARWRAIWDERLDATERRVLALLARRPLQRAA